MQQQKALELIELNLKIKAPYHQDDFYAAIATFIPLMRAAAQLEELGLTPIVQATEYEALL